ncbi:MAG TPA: IPT/TIG domain-containing protein [Bryobacteraceae bacterium]|nr:IPT/TIG domain-containing protein [Bryobacteraceae bacterium]
MKLVMMLAWVPALSHTAAAQVLSYTVGPPVTFATHAELAGYGFLWGPSDGQFGAIAASGNSYTFYGAGGSAATCAGTPKSDGTYTFTGTLDHVTGSNGCRRLFGPGDGPAGWVFDRDYAGGGQVVRFASGGKSGWLMAFHGEYHWQNPATANGECAVSGGTSVPCFYSGIGLAVSTDNGKTFQPVGEILEPSQPLSVFTGGGANMTVGYGSLIVADANGKHLSNPPADPGSAYFYLFFNDMLPGLPGYCVAGTCAGVARAGYADVITAALSGDPHQVAKVFHKYDGASPNPWTQPATSDTPDLSGTAGKYAPLWTDEPGAGEVLYDSTFDVYLAVIQLSAGIHVRASSDLIHWTEPIGPVYGEPGRTLYYPTLMGETGDPTIGGPAPRVYFSSFPTGSFPDYTTQIFESVTLTLSPTPPGPLLTPGAVENGATYISGGLVPGSWAQARGFNLSGMTRVWGSADFAGLGNNLPTDLSGVEVKVNGVSAAVYYISPDQVNFQAPAGISGNVSVQVFNNGVGSNAVTAAASASSPAIFPVIENGVNYAGGVFLDGKRVGDPSIGPAFRNAKPGDVIALFATGLAPSPAGVLVTQQAVSGVTVTIGTVTVPADFAGLVGVGEFQINFTVPQQFANRAEGTYPISIQVSGVSSPVTINSNPPGEMVLPIQH